MSLADRVRAQLEAAEFKALASGGRFVRKRDRTRHRVEFSGAGGAQPSLIFEDAVVRRLVPDWRAGGPLSGPAFALDLPSAQPRLARTLVEQLSFFDWLESPEAVGHDVSCRYVAGFIDPALIVPYLVAHLGPNGVERYAAGLLAGRSELTPAFASELRARGRTVDRAADHGTQLAQALRRFVPGVRPALPDGVCPSTSAAARNLRCFFGRQLRAWGEPGCAQALARVDDETIQRLHGAQLALRTPVTSSVEAVRLVMAAVGTERAPRVAAPSPRFFQYHARHLAPFRASAREA